MRRQSLNGGCDRSWSSVFAVMITSSVEDVSRQNSQLLNFGGKAQSFLSFIQINVSTGSHIYLTYVCRFRTEFIFGRAKIQESILPVSLLSLSSRCTTKSARSRETMAANGEVVSYQEKKPNQTPKLPTYSTLVGCAWWVALARMIFAMASASCW